MKVFWAFFKKEVLERIRSGRLFVLIGIFAAIGILNPATAKLTPWLLETFWSSIGEGVGEPPTIIPTALDSFTQFYKNIPIGLFALVLLEGGILTKEYASGTLIAGLTRGLTRNTVIAAKALTLLLLYTVGYWLCFLVTYGYNAFYFDNSVAVHPHLAALLYFVFGAFVLSLLVLASTLASDTTEALLATGGGVLLCYLLALIPPVKKYLPTYLTSGTSIVYGKSELADYLAALAITLVLTGACAIGAFLAFRKKQL